MGAGENFVWWIGPISIGIVGFWVQWKIPGDRLCIVVESWMESKTKNIKNSLGATWNASHLAVQLCALRHWKRVSMPPTTQSLRHPLTRAVHFAPRIKTARRFTAKKPLMITWFLGKKPHQISQTISHGRGATLRVCVKWLIFNIVLQLWADVKYREHWKSKTNFQIES